MANDSPALPVHRARTTKNWQFAEKANATIREERLLELTDRDMDDLRDAIANPPAPNEGMMRSIARWRERGEPSVSSPASRSGQALEQETM